MRENRKAVCSLTLILLLVSSLVIGCGSETRKSAESGQQKVIKLKFAHHNSTTSNSHVISFVPWTKQIEEKSNGKVKFEIYPSATLAKPADVFDAVKSGIADIAWGFVGFYPNRFPLTEAVGLPMLGIDSASMGSKVLWDLYSNTPAMQQEFRDVKVLMLHTHEGAPMSSKTAVRTMADLAGLKLRTPGGPALAMMQSLGASPIVIGTPEIYQAAEKGVISGVVMSWEGLDGININEVQKNVLDAKLFVAPFFVVMNKKTWDSLPPDVQKVFEEECGAKGAQLLAKAFDEPLPKISERFKQSGVTISELSAAEQAVWREKAKAIWDQWAAGMEAKGLPGKAVLTEAQKLIEKHKSK
jgi:TRAP-type C4-dicarboxylate transport system substrate-binding protein